MSYLIDMALLKNSEIKAPILARILNLIWVAVGFPRAVSRKLYRYNTMLHIIQNEDPKLTILGKYRAINNRAVNLLILAPIIVGFALFAFSFHEKWAENRMAIRTICSFPKIRFTKSGTKQSFYDVKAYTSRLSKISFDGSPFKYLAACYCLAIAGATLLSFHPAFRQEKKIKKLLEANRYLDENGSPWGVVWTPEVVFFEAYQVDALALQRNERFWSTLSFNPDHPQPFKDDSTKLIFKRAYALPGIIHFKFTDINSNQKGEEPKFLANS